MRIDKAIVGALRDGRCVNKLSNLLCLTGCGFHGHLEKGGLVSPNMGTLCRAYELVSLAISNIGLLEQKLKKLLYTFLALLAMLSSNDAPKRCL